MRSNYLNCRCTHCESDEANNRELEFEIRAHAVPYTPASMYGGPDHLGWPAEGGGVEDIEIKLMKVTEYDENGEVLQRKTALSEQERTVLEESFEKWLYSPDGKTRLGIIEDNLCEDAGQREEGAREAHYDSLMEAKWEREHGLLD